MIDIGTILSLMYAFVTLWVKWFSVHDCVYVCVPCVCNCACVYMGEYSFVLCVYVYVSGMYVSVYQIYYVLLVIKDLLFIYVSLLGVTFHCIIMKQLKTPIECPLSI